MTGKNFYLPFFVVILIAGIVRGGNNTNGKEFCNGKLKHPKLVKTFSEGNLIFSLSLYKNIAKGKDNVFISPFSISVVLAMTSAGAGGRTLSQMTDTLQLNAFSDENNVNRAIHSVLNSVCSTPNYNLSTANRMYVEKKISIEIPFKKILKKFYESSAENADFQNNANEEAKKINQWVEEQTQNHIKDLFPVGSLSSSTILVLVNAIYFKGNWKHRFPEENTKPENFKLTNINQKLTPMMNTVERLNYADSKELNSQILELPYQGDRLVMLVILPNEVEGINQLKEQLTAESFKALKNISSPRDVIVKLPKFKLDYKEELNQILSNMGISDLFKDGQADLSKIAPNLLVSNVIHQAFVSVDEKGTTAAAATGIALGYGVSAGNYIPPPVQFTVDHPFVFVIYDKVTELVLFIGNVNNPFP